MLTWQENVARPVISNFTPQTGLPGTVVTVTGANFLGVSGVTIGGTAAGFAVVSAAQMMVTVPTGAVTGPLEITGPLGTGTSSANFVVIQPVSNDAFVNATVISGPSGTITGNNTGATKEPGEPDIAGNPGGKSIWYVWKPEATGPVTFTTFGSSFNTLLGVFTGTAVADLTVVASNDDYGDGVTSSVTFLANSGTTYHIAVDGYNGASGNVVLNWSKDSSMPIITGFSPTSGPQETTLQISGSNFTGATEVRLGTTALSYTVVSNTEIVATVPTGATTGLIFVGNLLGTVNSSNPFTVTASPSNDDFANSIPLSGTTVHVTGANVGATKEPGSRTSQGTRAVLRLVVVDSSEQRRVCNQHAGEQFRYTAGRLHGNAVDALTLVASNNDDPSGGVTSYVTISATAGTVYRIAVDGLNGATGAISLSIYPQQMTTDLYSTGFEADEGFVAGDPLGGQEGWQTWNREATG